MSFAYDDYLNMDFDKAFNQATSGKKVDERFWKPDVTKDGTYIIRFIISKSKTPFVEKKYHYVTHFPNGEKKTTKGFCPKMKGKKCRICDKGWDFFNTKTEEGKAEAKNLLARNSYVCNIQVIKDPFNEENNGKVFLYEFKKTIYDFINIRINPTKEILADDDFVQFNPFNPIKSADFKLVVKMKPTNTVPQPTYTSSMFRITKVAELSPISADKNELVKVIESTYDLNEVVEEFAADMLSEETITQELGHLFEDSNEESISYDDVKVSYDKAKDKSKKTKKSEEDLVDYGGDNVDTVDADAEFLAGI